VKITCPNCGTAFDMGDEAELERHQTEIRSTPAGWANEMHREQIVNLRVLPPPDH
jgi:hypothetical protein